MNLARVGTCAAVGVIGQLVGYNVKAFKSPISGHSTPWNIPVGMAALLIGAVLQVVRPTMAPDVVDGLVDAGTTITAYFATGEAQWLANVTPDTIPSPVFPSVMGSDARGALGGYGGVPKVELV